MEVMLEIYQTLKTLGMEWREKPGLNIISRPEDEGAPGKDGKDIYYVETRCRIRDFVVGGADHYAQRCFDCSL
jgi:carbon catabolite-derepressing protein kinase